METTLLQKLKNALADGEINEDVRGDVLAEMVIIIATNNSCSIGLNFEKKLDAAERALKLFLVGWEKMVSETDNMWDFRRKMTTLCLNACQIERRNSRGICDAPMGVRMGDNFPDTWDI